MKQFSEKTIYLLLIISLNTGYLLTSLFTCFAFLLPKKKKKDILFFTYCPKNDPGAIIRFQQYLRLFEKDGTTFDIFFSGHDEPAMRLPFEENKRKEQYFIYIKIFWKRLFQVMKGGNYHAVFIQRGLFPFYPDQKFPHLERLLRKLNHNITLDFYDANYVSNKELVDRSMKYCDKITVVNQHLFNYFSQIHSNVFEFPLALDPTSYMVKKNYSLNNPIKIIWSGSYENAKKIKPILPVLKHISDNYPIELILICPEKPTLQGITIKHYKWDESTFLKLIHSADIALYPALKETETNKGKMALKVLEYMATALPIVASPWGIPSTLKDEYSVLISDNINEWEINLTKLIKDQELRENIGKNSYEIFHKYHTIENSYKRLKRILLEE